MLSHRIFFLICHSEFVLESPVILCFNGMSSFRKCISTPLNDLF